MCETKKGGFLTGMVGGLVLGAGIYYFLKSEKGKRAAKNVLRKSKVLFEEYLEREKEKLGQGLMDVSERIKEEVEDKMGEIKREAKPLVKKFFKNTPIKRRSFIHA